MAEGGKGALRELVAYLGFDLDEKKLDKAESRVDGLKEKSETLTKALELVGISLAGREIGEFINSQIEMGAAVEHASQQLGVSTDDLQAFQYAAETAGVSSEDATQSLGFLNRAIGAAHSGNEEAAKAFAQFGVQLRDANGEARPLADVVGDLADGFSRTDDTGKKTVAAMTLFGRAGRNLIPLLNKGRDGVEGLYAEFEQLGGGLSEGFIKTAGEAEHQMVRFKFASMGLSSELGVTLLPFISDLASDAAGALATFREWTKHTHFLRNALITLAAIGAILVVTWGIMNIEILLVVAALALLALAVDDVVTFFEGGDSVLGRFLDKLYGVGSSKTIAKELKDAWKEVSDAFGKLWDAVKDLGPDLKDLFATFSQKHDINSAKTGIQSMADSVASLATNLKDAVQWFDKMIKKFDDFAKAHPVVVHAFQRSAHTVGSGNVTIFGALGDVGSDIKEAVTGDASDVEAFNYDNPTGTVSVPTAQNALANTLAPPPVVVHQQNHTEATFYGLPTTEAAALRLQQTVRGAQTDANNDAFAAVGGGGAP